jgi:hypothetical protein
MAGFHTRQAACLAPGAFLALLAVGLVVPLNAPGDRSREVMRPRSGCLLPLCCKL